MDSVPNVLNYTDYRKFLNDVFSYFKNSNPKYSHRFIAKEVGASSSGWFSDILKGRINCTPRFINKLTNVFKLSDQQKEYFELLVCYNQAGSIEEKQTCFKKMLSFNSTESKMVFTDQFEFYSKWYIPAIRELLFIYDFCDNFKKLSQKLSPPITVKEAKNAIGILLSCKLIQKDNRGFFKPCDSILEKDASTSTVFWATYMSENIALSKEAIYRFKKEERDFSALTLLFSKKGFEIAREKIKELRKTLLKLSETDSNRTNVYQANLQLFPMSKAGEKE